MSRPTTIQTQALLLSAVHHFWTQVWSIPPLTAWVLSGMEKLRDSIASEAMVGLHA